MSTQMHEPPPLLVGGAASSRLGSGRGLTRSSRVFPEQNAGVCLCHDAEPHDITTRPGWKPGELIVQLPAGWELRLRRVLRTMLDESLPNPREPGLTPG